MNSALAQSDWNTAGNSAGSGDFIGTTNTFPFIIKTDDVIRLVIDEDGLVTIKNLEGTAIRLLKVNEDGELIALEAGSPTQVLNGEGEWIPLPPWERNGSGHAFFNDKVGIGTDNPTKELEVSGDAFIHGILESDFLKTGIIRSSALSGTGNRLVIASSLGELEALMPGNSDEVLNGEGEWIELPVSAWEMNGAGDISISSAKVGIGVSNPTKDLHIEGEVLIEGDVTVDSLYAHKIKTNELEFGTDTFSYKFGTLPINGGGIAVWGGSIPPAGDGPGGSISPFPDCTGWGKPNLFQQSGMFQAYGPGSYLFPPANAAYRSLFMGVAKKSPTDSETHGYIEMTDAKTSPTDGITASILHINTRCGRDVKICNENDGVVTVGNNFEAGTNISRDLAHTINVHSENTAMYIKTTHGAPWGFNTILEVDDEDTKVLEIRNPSLTLGPHAPFLIMGDGRTAIGTHRCTTSTHLDALLQVSGKILGQSLYILNPVTHWPDYVFEDGYSLMPIEELEQYYKKEKHLPEIPTASEVEQNGLDIYNLNEVLVKKVEELTLYVVEQMNLIKALEYRINKLEK